MTELKKGIIKELEFFRYKYSPREVFMDAVELIALSIAAVFDPKEGRDERSEAIIEKYEAGDKERVMQIRDSIVKMLSGMPGNFGDHLGEIYLSIGAESKAAGQFFTPYNVSRLIAELTFDDAMLHKDMVTINEPTCGAGGMLLATLECMTKKNFNYAEHALIVANDIDRNCVNMTYVQLSFAGAAAVVKWQDTLTQKSYDAFTTSAFTLNYERFIKAYHNLYMDSEM